MDTNTFIPDCAKVFLAQLTKTWESEEAMAEVFHACGRGPVFDRTTHGRSVVEHLFNKAWGISTGSDVLHPTGADRAGVLAIAVLSGKTDWNMISQVASNLLYPHLLTNTQALEEEKVKEEVRFTKLSSDTGIHNPFTGGRAKTKVASENYAPDLVSAYQRASGISKASSILAGGGLAYLSCRISPREATPAITDDRNFSALPIVGDEFLRPANEGSGVVFVPVSNPWPLEAETDGSLTAVGLPEGANRFLSKSGGDILSKVLASRHMAFALWELWALEGAPLGTYVYPRFNSVMVVAPLSLISLIQGIYPDASIGVRLPAPE